MALPFMPFYWGDYWRDTAHLSDAEHVSYLRLISHYWQHGALPTTDERLSRIAGRTLNDWLEMKETMKNFFSENWSHNRIERDLQKQKEISNLNTNRAKKAAFARWNASSMLQALPKAITEQCSTIANHNHNHIQNNNNNILERKKSNKGTRLSENWNPKPEDGFNEIELAKFRDYWKSVAGQKGVKRDWDATWRNWLRNSKQWNGNLNGKNIAPESYRIGHPKGIVKFEPEQPKLSEEELRKRSEFVKSKLKNFGISSK